MGIFRNRPAVGLTDNTMGGPPTRSSWYGDAYQVPMGAGNWALADEGSYFFGANATLATGIAGHAAPVVADTDTKPLIHIYNGGARHIVLDFVQLEVTVAGTAGTLHYTTIYVDNQGASSRSSGGTAITMNNTRSDNPTSSAATVFVGAVVAAPTTSRKVGQAIVREVIPVVQDTVLMVFGSADGGLKSGLATSGTGTNHLTQWFPPIVVAPGGNVGIAQIRPSQSAAASYQFQLGYWER